MRKQSPMDKITKTLKVQTKRRKQMFSIENGIEKAPSLFNQIGTVIKYTAIVFIAFLIIAKTEAYFWHFAEYHGLQIAINYLVLFLLVIAYGIMYAPVITQRQDKAYHSKPCGHPIDSLWHDGDVVRCLKCGEIVDINQSERAQNKIKP